MQTKTLLKPALLGALTSLAMSVSVAQAAPMPGPADSSFYTPPVMAGGNHGDLIWYRPATANLGPATPAANAWNVMYHSTDAKGAANIVTGTVIVPSAGWTNGGDRPVINYAVGTHGLAKNCAPSKQLAAGTDYEAANIAAALARGYAVLVTDNPGYTTGSESTYLSGKAQGHAVLDIFTAATQLPGAGIDADAPTAIWGYSQGGQTASFAGELVSSYAPDMNLSGIAAGGTPADFINTAEYLNASTGASFLLQAVIGLAEQYPEGIPLDSLASPYGKAEIEKVKADQCVFDTLFPYMNKDISEYTVGGQQLPELMAIPSVNQTLTAQRLGGTRIPVPVYQYHGTADEFIPIEQHTALKGRYCSRFGNVTFGVFPSEHIVTQFQAAPTVLDWLGDRFDGKSTSGTCLTFRPKPTSNANPGGGNFVVSLDEWPLDAKLHLATLDQEVLLPEDSTFTADTDMTAGTLDGTLDVPRFTSKLKILVNLDVRLDVTPAGRTTGTASLDNNGQLAVNGLARTNIGIRSAGFGWLQLPFGCATDGPVDFPVNFAGPVSSLGNGNLTFTGETTFPKITSCWPFNGLFTTLMSGPGQQYSFNVSPPEPTTW